MEPLHHGQRLQKNMSSTDLIFYVMSCVRSVYIIRVCMHSAHPVSRSRTLICTLKDMLMRNRIWVSSVFVVCRLVANMYVYINFFFLSLVCHTKPEGFLSTDDETLVFQWSSPKKKSWIENVPPTFSISFRVSPSSKIRTFLRRIF